MELIRNYLAQIRQFWAGLSHSARLATGLLVLLVAVAIGLLVRYGSKPEMVPVFSTALGDAELGRAKTVLAAAGYKPAIVDGRLVVPASNKVAAFAALAAENILPEDTASAFEELAKTQSMWNTSDQNDYIHKQAKQAMLSRLIGRFPNVRKAQVILEPGTSPGLGRPAVRPTAAVQISMEPGHEMNRRQVAAVADLVSGSVPGMTRGDVRMVADGRSYRIQEEETSEGDARLERLSSIERYFDERIAGHLRYIPDVIVTTHALPDPLREETKVSEDYDPDKVATAVLRSMTSNSTGGASASGGEPGTIPNGSASIETFSSGGGSRETSDEEFDSRFTKQMVTSYINGGVIKEITTSVNVPRSYLMAVYKEENRTNDEPLKADFDRFIPPVLEGIRTQVMNAIGAKDDAQVEVAMYISGRPEMPTAPAQAGVGELATRYGKPAALSVLALASLMMVMMFVRRRNPMVTVPEPTTPAGGLLDTTIGAVEGEDGVLIGMELDDETIRSQKVVEHVATMVKKNPESAANLVRRWIQKK